MKKNAGLLGINSGWVGGWGGGGGELTKNLNEGFNNYNDTTISHQKIT